MTGIKTTERFATGWTDPRGLMGGNGGTTATSISLRDQQLRILEQDVALINYILQRTVPNYDELVTQFKAIEDIKGAEQWEK
jgi:3D (Asp-Asp-Asp) domain-containing protein